MTDVLFYVFAALAVAGALGMLLNVKNTVAGALSLVGTMVSLGAIYVLLDAYLIGVLQILVYAGAILVVFLFVVMLLNLRTTVRRQRLAARARRRSGRSVRLLSCCPVPRPRRRSPGLRRLPRGGRGAVHRLRARVRGHVAAAAGRDDRRGDPRQAEDRRMIPITHAIALSGILFLLGAIGALTRRNLIAILMSIELMLNAVNLSLVAFSRQWGDHAGQMFVVMVIVVAAAEVAVGLGIVISLFRNRESVNVEDASLLKW
jgi:NADH-quinone oxidoreductase subunit K